MAQKTPNQIEYEKQIARITKRIETLEGQGYIVPKDIIPPKGKKISKPYLKTLKNITPKYIKSKSIIDTQLEAQQFVKQNVKPKGKKVAKEIKGNVKADKYTPPQEIEPPVTTTSPDAYDVFDRITDLIEAVPSIISCRDYGSNKWIDYSWQSQYNLMGVFIKSMQEAERQGTKAELAEYYESKETELSNALTIDFMPSDLMGVQQHFIEAIKILNVGEVLSMEDRKDLRMIE